MSAFEIAKKLGLRTGMCPSWCNDHGGKMQLGAALFTRPSITIASSAAKCCIEKSEDTNRPGWFLEYEVVQFHPTDEKFTGRIWFSDDELAVAFGLKQSTDRKKWFGERFVASAAVQGKFIREGIFLNIPGPGTGNDGDPNISIHIDDEIIYAVADLLGITVSQ